MTDFQFTKATKAQAKARLAIAGPAGSGKTYSALNIAKHLTANGRIAVIDTEHGSASKYAGDFQFDVLELTDFHPQQYVEAIQAAQKAGYDTLIIDSASHEWNGRNGCLELVEVFAKRQKTPNSFAAWGDVTPLHNAFIEAIHAADVHIIVTYRSKMEYVQTIDGGKTTIKKVGMAPITRDGAEYEMDVAGDLDLDHTWVISKSRCRELADKVIAKPGKEVADILRQWLSEGTPAPSSASAFPPEPVAAEKRNNGPADSDPVVNDYTTKINDCHTLGELDKVTTEIRAVELTAHQHDKLGEAFQAKNTALKRAAARMAKVAAAL